MKLKISAEVTCNTSTHNEDVRASDCRITIGMTDENIGISYGCY